MKFQVFFANGFFVSLSKLLAQDVSLKTAYKLKKIRDLLVVESEKCEEMRKDLVKQYAEKDDKGEIKTQPNATNSGQPTIVFAGGNEKLFGEKIKELKEIEFQTPGKIKHSELNNIVLTANDVTNLSDLLEE